MLSYLRFQVTLNREIRASVFWMILPVPSRAVGVRRLWHGPGKGRRWGEMAEGEAGRKVGGSQEILGGSFSSRRSQRREAPRDILTF